MSSDRKIFIVEHLSLRILVGRMKDKAVYYVTSSLFVKLWFKTSFLRNKFPNIQPLPDEGPKISARTNLSLFWYHYDEALRLGHETLESLLKNGSLGDHLKEGFSKERVRLHLSQKIVLALNVPLRLLVVADHYQNEEHRDVELILRKTPIVHYLDRFIKNNALKVSLVNDFSLKETLFPVLIFLRLIFELFINQVFFVFKAFKSDGHPKLGVCFLNGISGDRRNDLFWFGHTGLDPKDILVYFISPHCLLTPDIERELKSGGFSYFNALPFSKTPGFLRRTFVMPSAVYLKLARQNFVNLINLLDIVFNSKNKEYLWQWKRLATLLSAIVNYESIFRVHNVKLHFSLFGLGNELLASNIGAMRAGSVDISTHWSNFPSVHFDHANAHDTQLCWGQYHQKIFETLPSLNPQFIRTGYIYDGVFKKTKVTAESYRAKFQSQGVNFIVTFFDESFMVGWNWLEMGALKKIYSSLFKLVLDDPQLGLIIKPKSAKSFRAVVGQDFDGMLQQAISTQRCMILDQGQFPSEAAQASDLVVGVGAMNTAVLESILCSKPFLIYDQGLTYHPYYKFGLNKVIFNDVETMIKKLIDLKHDKDFKFYVYSEEYKNFIREVDSFRDGKAAERIGFYVQALWQRLLGHSKEKSLLEANLDYMKRFGPKSIADFKSSAESGNAIQKLTCPL